MLKSVHHAAAALLLLSAIVHGQGFTCPTVVIDQPPPAGPSQFGGTVALDGDVLAVGDARDDIVAVYAFDGGWTLIGQTPAGAGRGSALAVSDNRVAIGVPGEDANTPGQVELYQVIAGSLVLEEVLTATPPTAGDRFGQSLALNGNRLLVGSPSGQCTVFETDGANWQATQAITPAGNFVVGQVLALHDDLLAIGAFDRVIFYRHDGANWLLEDTLVDLNPLPMAMDLRGDVMAVGHDGVVDVYRHTSGAWTLESTLTAWDGTPFFLIAVGVGVDSGGDDLVVVGAWTADLGGTGAGTAYVFRNAGGGWGADQQLGIEEPGSFGHFGVAVALHGDRALIGTRNQNSASGTRHVYLFDLNDGAASDCRCAPYCPNNCSGNGDCLCNVCDCDNGWGTPDCSVRVCPNDCSGNGACIDGTCFCDPGWLEDDCGCMAAPCPNDCSDNGSCSVCGVCTCDAGWEGPMCATPCPDLCHGNGACVGGTCVCDPGWGGATCDDLLFQGGRLFMTVDGNEHDVPYDGDSLIAIQAGSTRQISVWIESTETASALSHYQIVIRWHADPQPGATGAVSYVDNGTLGGNSVRIDVNRADWPFAGEPAHPPVYNETEAQNGFGFIGSLDPFSAKVPLTGVFYLGEFEVATTADAAGAHRLTFVPKGSAPAGGTSIGCGHHCTIDHLIDLQQPLTIVVTACGNGVLELEEGCDDGNGFSGDGCTATCSAEFCGDGTMNNAGTEACDDGNGIDGDGCSAACAVEFCGDGVTNNNTETCDDGNVEPGDGCSASCTVEPGYTCAGQPSQCVADLPATSRWSIAVVVLVLAIAVGGSTRRARVTNL